MASLNDPDSNGEGAENIESINRRIMGFLQVRLSEQESWRARIFSNELPQLEPWQSKDHVDDDVPIRTPPDISARVKSFIESAVSKEESSGVRNKNVQLRNSIRPLCGIACTQSPLYDGVPLIDATAIRVIEILPGTRDTTIRCLLKAVDTNSKPLYEALSYVWGTEDHATPIYVNNTAVFVKENLFEAMWNLRLDDTPRIIWIDSLCINQIDVIEKSFQVAQMDNIYRSASNVIVFFGPESHDSRVLFDFLDTDPSFNQNLGYTNSREEITIAFWNISQAPWWRRVWVLQEYSLARNDPVIQFGRKTILSSNFIKYCRNLGSTWSLMYPKIRSKLRGAYDFRNDVDHLQRNLHTLLLRPASSSMWSLLLFEGSLLHCSATDPRDRIYAIREIMGPVFKRAFPPDYTIPTEILFTHGTVWLLTMEKFGDIWAFFPQSQFNHQPSWAVNLAEPFKHVRWEKGECANLADRASRNSHADVSIFNGILVIDGLEFDEIHTVVEIDESDILHLVRSLWAFDKLCSDFCDSLDKEPIQRKEFTRLRYNDHNSPWRSSVEWTCGIKLPYFFLWDLYKNSGFQQPHWSGCKHISKMSIIQRKCKREDIEWANILDLILCDFEQVQALVNQWKEFYPSHLADFDEYLSHAVYLHCILVGNSPQGFEAISPHNAPEGFDGPSLKENLAEAQKLECEIATMEPGVLKFAKQELLVGVESIIQKQMELNVQITIQQETESDPHSSVSVQMIQTMVESELMHTTMFFTTKGFRGYGVCGTRGFEKGDKVCLLDGVAVPMVLRKVEDKHHRIVGAAHVEGIMKGEALVLEQNRLLKQTSFSIR